MNLLPLALLLLAEPPAFLNINPTWSPDGRWLAFESSRHGEPEIYVVGADGTGLRRLTHNAGADTHPAWSPDGTTIVFDSDRDGTWNLYAIQPDGRGERRVTFPGPVRTKAFARHPSWAPDGRRVAFDSDRDGKEQVYALELATGATTRLTQSGAREGHAAWSTDGTIWFGSDRSGNVDVWRMDEDGGHPRAVVATPAMEAGAEPSPDARRIAYFAGEKPDLFVADADGTHARNLTNSPDAIEYELAWSPDGRRIAFYSDRTGRHEIYVVDADGTNLKQVTDTPYDDTFPVFTADGAEVVFSSNRDGDFELYRMRLDGGGLRRLTFSPGRDAHAAISPDGRTIAFQSPRDWSAEGEVDLYLMDLDGSAPRRLTTSPGFDGVPAWSADGRTLAFQRGVKGAGGWSWDVLTLDLASGEVRRLTATPEVNEQVPVFRGDQLVLFSNHAGGRNQLYRMPVAGGPLIPLLVSSGDDVAATVSPDGRFVAFVRDHDLHVMNADGGGVRRLTEGRQIWSGGSWSPDGRRLTFSDELRGRSEVYVIGADGSGLTRLTAGADGLREPQGL